MADHPAERPDRVVPTDVDPQPHPWTPGLIFERWRVWAAFIGPRRLAGAAGATLVIAGAGWWLLRSPALPTEAALPSVTHSSAVTATSTIAPQVADAVATSGAPGLLVIHVTGAVNVPGVYELSVGQRVDDAVAAAGGPSADADANALNLAAPLVDGDRIAVPVLGQTGAGGETPDAGVTHAVVSADASVAADPVDLNEATTSELEALPGIGPATAAAIVEYRTQTGPFGSIDQLLDVPGIGPAKLEAIREFVSA